MVTNSYVVRDCSCVNRRVQTSKSGIVVGLKYPG